MNNLYLLTEKSQPVIQCASLEATSRSQVESDMALTERTREMFKRIWS